MFLSTQYYLITVVTKPEVAEHLIPNIKGFEIVYYIKEQYKGGTPKDPAEKDIVKVEMLCAWDKMNQIMEYVKKYYVKGYGAVSYYEEVHVPI